MSTCSPIHSVGLKFNLLVETQPMNSSTPDSEGLVLFSSEPCCSSLQSPCSRKIRKKSKYIITPHLFCFTLWGCLKQNFPLMSYCLNCDIFSVSLKWIGKFSCTLMGNGLYGQFCHLVLLCHTLVINKCRVLAPCRQLPGGHLRVAHTNFAQIVQFSNFLTAGCPQRALIDHVISSSHKAQDLGGLKKNQESVQHSCISPTER